MSETVLTDVSSFAPDGGNAQVLLDLIGNAGLGDPHADGPCSTDVQTSSGRMRVYLDGPAFGPAVMLLHGFPEIAYSWRHQFHVLAEQGYRVIAVDLPGAGASDYDKGDEAYTASAIAHALVSCLDQLEVAQTHVVGHDWGARHAWAFSLLYPDRISSVYTINGPWQPRGGLRPLSMVPQDRFSFLGFLSSPDAPAILDRDPEETLRFFLGHLYGEIDGAEVKRLHGGRLQTTDPFAETAFGELPHWLSANDFEVYRTSFARTGFGPSLARYRNLDADWAQETSASPSIPCGALIGERDPSWLFDLYRPMLALSEHCRVIGVVPGAGHSLPSQNPGLVNSELLAFLQRFPDFK